ncbi:MAG: tetratricopeptide repeat protein [Tardiphaga sp.]
MHYIFENYVFDVGRHELLRGSTRVEVEPGVLDLLRYLIENRERVVSKDDLIEHVWNGRIVSESTMTSRITAARHAIGDTGSEQRLIRTVARKGVRFVGEVRESGGTVGPPPVAASLPDKPSVAILPFANLSGDPAQDYFSDGISEDIITELSRFSELFVIARNSSFQYKGKAIDVRQIARELGVRYLLEGSVRHADERVRISAQLVDAQTGAHRWAERYDRRIEDIFSVQDEVAQTVASVLSIQINRAEADRALLKPPTTWEAHDYFLRGNAALTRFLSRFTLDDLNDARVLLQRSIDLDPSYARAYAMLASSHIDAYLTGVNDEYRTQAALDRAFALARTAVEIEPGLPLAHAHLADVHLFRREYDDALATWGRVFELNPNFTDFRYGRALNFAGKFGDGLAAIKRHLRLDPFAPMGARLHLGIAYLGQKNYAEALASFREVVTRAPEFGLGRMALASTYALMGHMNEAREQITELLRIDPTCTVAKVARFRTFRDPKDGAHMLQGLLQAGLPPQ